MSLEIHSNFSNFFSQLGSIIRVLFTLGLAISTGHISVNVLKVSQKEPFRWSPKASLGQGLSHPHVPIPILHENWQLSHKPTKQIGKLEMLFKDLSNGMSSKQHETLSLLHGCQCTQHSSIPLPVTKEHYK